jgi:Ala-tRNA(Pro) deacylase
MPLARRLEDHLVRNDAKYDIVAHRYSHDSIETADFADIPGERLVKSVLLEDDDGKLLAVLPATLSVHIGHLGTKLQRRLRLADPGEVQGVFPDCRDGAVPPLGAAYGLRNIVDDSLEAQPEVYFEAGDHEHLVHMTGAQFLALLGPAERVHFGVRERHAHR